ncbi:MAG TPA: ribonuclease H-like domain-containing protein, partial [Planctomycetota bacterium]|nr:ribonuclease H-like domain-containing protein [Planctomycetota bacterium]
EAIAALLGGAPAPDIRRLAFLDTETTGLAGGTGTCVFLVGIGTFEEGAFRVRQHFLPAPDRERAMLRLVARELEGTEGLVTYNGRAFDIPALQTRMVIQRLPFGAAALPHFDLLLAMRRLYRNRLPSLRLGEAESRLLGVRRENDIAGHLIPSIYFDWVRAGRLGPLRAVLRHNETDILSLVSILSFAADLFSRPDLDPADLILLARWWEHRDEPVRAEAIYESAVPRLEEGPDWQWAARRYAILLKRSGSRGNAVGLWRRLWARGDIEAGIEVAKYLEHEARDLPAAEEVTSAVLGGAPGPRRAELEHRLSRIRRKLCRAPV